MFTACNVIAPKGFKGVQPFTSEKKKGKKKLKVTK